MVLLNRLQYRHCVVAPPVMAAVSEGTRGADAADRRQLDEVLCFLVGLKIILAGSTALQCKMNY